MFNHIRLTGNMAAHNGIEVLMKYDGAASFIYGDKKEADTVEITECPDAYYMKMRRQLVEITVLAIHHLSRYVNVEFVDELHNAYDTMCDTMIAWTDETIALMTRLEQVRDEIKHYYDSCVIVASAMRATPIQAYKSLSTAATTLVDKLVHILSYLLNVPCAERVTEPLLMQGYAILPGTLNEDMFYEWLRKHGTTANDVPNGATAVFVDTSTLTGKESRYIDAVKLMDDLDRNVLNDPNCPAFIAAEVAQCVGIAPTAEVEERKYGEWVEVLARRNGLEYVVRNLKCSRCGHVIKTDSYDGYLAYKFCYNCGAEMQAPSTESN